MKTLYLNGGNVSLSMVPEGLKIRQGDKTQVISPPYIPWDTILIQKAFGYVSFAALRILLSLHISVAMLGFDGRLLGHMSPWERRSGDIQTRQFKAVNDPKKRLAIAKSIATKGYRRRNLNPDFSKATNLGELRHIERAIADSYWIQWKSKLDSAWPENDFDGRVHPRYGTRIRAVTKVNAVLNYSYSLLKSTCRTVCHRVGLSPLHGFLHESQMNHAEPLVYDLEELGRAWVDEAVINWLSRKQNRIEFKREDGWVVRISQDGVKSLVNTISPSIKTEVLWRDARDLVKRL